MLFFSVFARCCNIEWKIVFAITKWGKFWTIERETIFLLSSEPGNKTRENFKLKLNYILLYLHGKLRIVTFAHFWNIEAAPIFDRTLITSPFLNILSSNMYNCDRNDQANNQYQNFINFMRACGPRTLHPFSLISHPLQSRDRGFRKEPHRWLNLWKLSLTRARDLNTLN